MRRSSVFLVSAAVVLAGAVAPVARSAVATAAPPRAHAATTRPTGRPARSDRGRYTARFTDVSGHPLAGVVVSAGFEATSPTARSSRDGRVTLTLRPGRYDVQIDGSHASGGVSDTTGYVGAFREVQIQRGRTRSSGTIALALGGAVHVHVTDTQGRPAVGVQPDLLPVTTYVQPDQDGGFAFFVIYSTSSAGTRTDADGDATLMGVPQSLAYQVCVNPGPSEFGGDGRFLSACSSRTVLARAGRTVSLPTLVVRRASGSSISGQLSGKAGRSLGFSTIEVQRGRELVASTLTARDGHFHIAGLRPGTYRFCAIGGAFQQLGRTGYLPGCAAHTITIAKSARPGPVSIVLKVAAAISGRVTGPGAAPVGGGEVELKHGDNYGTTDDHGQFVIKGLPAGRNSLCVDTSDTVSTKALPYGVRGSCPHGRTHFVAHIGRVRSGIRVRLRVGAAVRITVVDGRGRPVPNADLEASLVGGGFFDDEADSTADSRGHFVLRSLEPGRYRVCASSPEPSYGDLEGVGVHACHHEDTSAQVGHVTDHVRVVLPTTAAVRVSVVDEKGHGVAGVDATLVTACHGHCLAGTPLLPSKRTSVVSTVTTGSHGRALLDGLRPGHYALCLFAFYGTTRAGAPSTGYADRCVGQKFGVIVRAGHTTTERVVLHPGGSVTGRITDAHGAPLAGVAVHVAGSAADDLPGSELEPIGPDDPDSGGPSALPGFFSTTAADGSYTVRSVGPGDRLVCADPAGATGGSSHGGYQPQCVGGVPGSTAKGTPVTVSAGTTTGGVDLALASAGAIAGHVTSRVPDSESVAVVFRSGKLVDDHQIGRDGAYRFTGLIPGTYVVCVASFGGSSDRGRCYQDVAWNPDSTTPPSDASPVPVTAGAQTGGIDVTVPR